LRISGIVTDPLRQEAAGRADRCLPAGAEIDVRWGGAMQQQFAL